MNVALQENVAALRDQKYPLQYQVAIDALNKEVAGPARHLLNEYGAGLGQADAFDLDLLRYRIDRLPTRLLTPGPLALSVAYTRDGKYLAAGTDRGILCLWEAKTLAPYKQIQAHGPCLSHIAMSPTENLAATVGCDKLVKLWSTTTWEPVAELSGHSIEVGTCAFSPDGKLLATATTRQPGGADEPAEFFLWDVARSDSIVAQWRTTANLTNSLAFVDEGRRLIAGFRDGQFFSWDLMTRPPKPMQVTLPEELTSRVRGRISTGW